MKLALCGAATLVVLAGCSSQNVDSQEAVKQGVIGDLSKSKNINMGSMDVNVVSVRFRDKEADAVVAFSPKGGNASQGLTMNYVMERQGAEWHIKSRAQSDMQRHAAQAAPQAGPMGSLPPGHGDSQQLPPGHPSLDGSQKQ